MQNNCQTDHRRSAFTLVEMLVVIVIIVGLAAVSFVAIRTIRSKANAAKSASNIKQIYNGHMLYLAEYNHFPSGSDWKSRIQAEELVECKTWHQRLAPYVGLGSDLEETQEQFIPETPSPGVFQVPGRKRLQKGEGDFKSGYCRNPKIYQNDNWNDQKLSFKDLTPFTRLSASYFLIDIAGDSEETDYNGWEISKAALLKWPAHGGKTGTLNGNVVVCYFDGHVESPKKGDLSSNYRNVFWDAPTN